VTSREFSAGVRALEAALKHRAEARVAELRRQLREDHNVIYVRRHVVKAYWYERKARS
jgi:hypothetical protein